MWKGRRKERGSLRRGEEVGRDGRERERKEEEERGIAEEKG